MKETYKAKGNASLSDIFDNEIEGITIGDSFVELYIVKDQEITKAWTNAAHSDVGHHLEVLDSHQKWTKIELCDLFRLDNNTIIISGIAGYGKTYLLIFLATEWATNRRWEKFDLVTLLTARELNVLEQLVESGQQSIKSLYDIVVYISILM